MSIEPSTIFIQEIRDHYAKVDEPITELEAQAIARRLLALVELLARPAPPRNLPMVSEPKPIPRVPDAARIGESANATPDAAEFDLLEPGDHPRPAPESGEPQPSLPF